MQREADQAQENTIDECRVTGGTEVDSTLEITHHYDADGRTVLALRGEVDIETAPRLRNALTEQLMRPGGLVLDVSGAVLIDAAGLRVLTAAQRRAAETGRPPITLRGVRPLFAKTLHITGLDHLFPREPAPDPVLTERPSSAPRTGHRSQRPVRELAAV